MLRAALDAVHHAGMPGVAVEVRDGEQVWRGAAGVADLETGRPMTTDLRLRVGSVTKTFVCAAVMRQVERGKIDLDAPVSRYLPKLVRGDVVTVRMLMNHTSGFAEYLPYAFPSLRGLPTSREVSAASIDQHRFRRCDPAELIELGLAAPAGNEPGGTPGTYSNTNYLLVGQLLAAVTGVGAEEYVTRDVIERAGLEHTWFPEGPEIGQPRPRMYEALFGVIDPPQDYSVYDMSWAGPAASLVSTLADLNRFMGLLFGGEVVTAASLAQMRRTAPVISQVGEKIDYGLGLRRSTLPDGRTVWVSDGTVWGAGATAMIREDGSRRMAAAVNLVRWRRPSPLDEALPALHTQAMCGDV
ncbi:serine hydrolase domain-containing protein [Actinophytocola sp. NPDC049390]|uniref:serine hydrolase domain-containing protein n=1 Tax=Actinophytocola sp. NPDC049390 TaxID=3363894 RepID=UPI0037ADA539